MIFGCSQPCGVRECRFPNLLNICQQWNKAQDMLCAEEVLHILRLPTGLVEEPKTGSLMSLHAEKQYKRH